MKIRLFINLLITSSLLAFTGCQMPSPTQQPVPKSIMPQSFKPYAGPVSLAIDTGLSTKTVGKKISLSSQNKGFQTLSTASSRVIFEETFTHTTNAPFERSVSVMNPEQNYLLEVIRHESNGNSTKMGVEINGVAWVQPKDFKNGVDTISREQVLLQAQNLLKLSPQGPKGSRVTVRLRTGDVSGTLLRSQGQWISGIPTQTQREAANEQNLFNPDVLGSLGALEPYEGDIVDTENPNAPTIGLIDTQGALTKIQVGYLTAYVNEPVAANLVALQSQFPVDVVFQEQVLGDTMVSLKIRLDEVVLSKMPLQWQQLNQRMDRPSIAQATFSSLNTAKTLAVLTDMHINQGGLLKDVGFSNILEKTAAPIIPQEASNPQNDGLWWLDKIHATEAWYYGLGEGATVAILDSDFGTGFVTSNPDITEGRVRIRPFEMLDETLGSIVIYNRYLDMFNLLNPLCSLKQSPRGDCHNDITSGSNHGGKVLSLIAAGLNDGEGSVGVAPDVKVLPFYLANGTASPMMLQLQQLLDLAKSGKEDIDVINISFRYNVSPLGVFFASLSYSLKSLPDLSDGLDNLALKFLDAESKKTVEIIQELIFENDVTIVASAGNDDKDINLANLISTNKTMAFPAVVPHVISVGAYDKQQRRARFTIRDEPGSNYSSQVKIWAPGKDLVTASYNRQGLDGEYGVAQFNTVQGTSYSAPLVAGAVALMRSANPNLKPLEIQEILQETADTPSDPSSFLVPGETYPIYLLNVLKAMQHPKVGARPAETYNLRVASQDYLVDYERRIPVDNPIPDVNPSNLFVELFENDLADYPEIKEGDCVKVTGWTHEQSPGVPYAKIKPLTLEKDDNPPAGCKQSFRTLSLSTDDNAPTQENPFTTQSITFPESTSYIKVTLAGDSQGQKLFLRHKNLDSHSIAAASISSTPEQHESQANKVVLGTDFTEVGSLSETQTVIIAVTNNGDSSDFYTVEMALAPDDNRRVVVQSTSSFSMGSMEPVQVLLKIKDSNGNPANGNYFVGLDRNAGSFKVLAPVPGAGVYSSSGTFVKVENGTVLLEYLPRGVTRDYGTRYCGGTTCKNISARFQVSGCDYSYYGTQRCPIIGPDATGPYADEGRVYTTWINGWGEPYALNLTANGQTHDVEFTGLTDSAGRVVPDGFILYVTNPYYGSITRLDGTGSGVWTPIAVQNGALRFRYTSVKADHCWPFSPSLVDEVHFDDSRFRESWTAPALRATYLRASDCN